MFKILFTAVLMVLGISAFAQPRSEHEALDIAQKFWNVRQSNAKISIAPISAKSLQNKTRRGNSVSGCYVINDEANKRFVIISADERMPQILGYSDNGIFSAESAPEALLDMIDEYNTQYDFLLSNNLEIYQNPQRVSDVNYPIMIQTKWGQKEPYWNECPLDANGQRCVTGCVATAMAQVMNYHRWPEKGQGGIVSYNARTYITSIAQSFDFDALRIDWNNMLDAYDTGATQVQKDEVAKLMHACGVSVYMDYTSGESGADDPNIPYALINNFGYNPNIYYAAKAYYEIDEWHQLIDEELQAGRPILYSGDGSGGHQFVLDGKKDGLYHFNFGWEGDDDGYFLLDAITPGSHNYNSSQAMILGVCPTEAGSHKDVFYTDEFKLDTIADIGGKAKIQVFKPYCFSSEANTMVGKARFVGEYGVGLFDKDFNFIKSLYKYKGSFIARSSQTSYSGDGNYIHFDNETFINGKQYYVAPYAKGENSSSPTLMRTLNGFEDWYRVSVNDNKVVLERKKVITDNPAVLGDSNGDGVVDVADIVNIVNYIMNRNTESFIFINSDIDKDGVLDVEDITLIIGIIMKSE